MHNKTLTRILELKNDIFLEHFSLNNLEPSNSEKYDKLFKRVEGIIRTPRYSEFDFKMFIEEAFTQVPLSFQQRVIDIAKVYNIKNDFTFDFESYVSWGVGGGIFSNTGQIIQNDQKGNPWEGGIDDKLTSYIKYATHPESRILIKLNEGGEKDQFYFERKEAYFREDLPKSQNDTLKIVEFHPSGQKTTLGLKYQRTPLEYETLSFYEREDYTLESVGDYKRLLLIAQHLNEK